MEKRIYDTAEDIERKKAVRAFFDIFNSLREKRALRWNEHSDLKSAWIEIREYKNNGEIKTICRVNAENETDCYRMAADRLKWESDRENLPRPAVTESL